MIKKIVVFILAFCIVVFAATKILIHGVLFRGLDSQKSVTYLPPDPKTSLPLVFDGVEVNLPWAKVNNVNAMSSITIFSAEGSTRLTVMRLPTKAEASKLSGPMHLQPPAKNGREKIRDKVERFFLGDLGQLISRPEWIDHMYVALPSNVTWWSNPLFDMRTAVGLMLRVMLDGFHDMYVVENENMRGYHTHFKRSGRESDAYDLGMKDGSCKVILMMFNGSPEYATSVLGSIRVVMVPTDFSQAAFETSEKLALASHGDTAAQKLAVLTAMEAASNTSPNLKYFTHVLDLCQKFHFLVMGRSWLEASYHYFPASIPKLMARYQEFDPKKTMLTPITVRK
jgi:hypothetical protein